MQLKGVDMLYLQNSMAKWPESGHNAACPQLPRDHGHRSGILRANVAPISSEGRQGHSLETPLQNDAMPEHPVGGCYEGTLSGLFITHGRRHFTGNNEPSLADYTEIDPTTFEAESFPSMEGFLPPEQVNIHDSSSQQNHGQALSGHPRDTNGWDQGMGSQLGDHYQPAGKFLPD